MPTAFDVKFAFNKWTLGEEFCRDVLGISAEAMVSPTFDLLAAFGFSKREIEAANIHCCGAMTMEGAVSGLRLRQPVRPHRQALPLGRKPHPHDGGSTRSSPAPSPRRSTCRTTPPWRTARSAYLLTWKLMLKANARDGSQLSAAQLVDHGDRRRRGYRRNPPEPAGRRAWPTVVEKLIDRRVGCASATPCTHKTKAGSATSKIYLRTGEYEDGLGEIFIDMHKEGAAFRSMTNCFAIAVSLGLQHGVPLDEYVDAFLFTRFEPNGVVQGNPHIKMTTSIIDYIFRELAITYLGRHDLAHVDPPRTCAPTPSTTPTRRARTSTRPKGRHTRGGARCDAQTGHREAMSSAPPAPPTHRAEGRAGGHAPASERPDRGRSRPR